MRREVADLKGEQGHFGDGSATGGERGIDLAVPSSGRHHPGGIAENSPAFQRWERSESTPSPEGTVEPSRVSRPSGTSATGRAHPELKRWAILRRPSGT